MGVEGLNSLIVWAGCVLGAQVQTACTKRECTEDVFLEPDDERFLEDRMDDRGINASPSACVTPRMEGWDPTSSSEGSSCAWGPK